MGLKKKQLENSSPAVEYEATEHFIGGTATGGALNLIASAVGGTAQFQSGGINTPGICRFQTGVTATGSYMIRGLPTALWVNGSGQINYRCRFKYRLPTLPVSATDPAIWVVGFGNASAAGEPTAGAYLYVDSIDGIMYFVCKNTAGRTAIANGLHPANKWLECYITLQRNMIARFEIQDSEDSPNFTTFVVNTNFPNVGVNICAGILKTAGTVTRYLDMDYLNFGFNNQAPLPS